jgi:hypothetical protein
MNSTHLKKLASFFTQSAPPTSPGTTSPGSETGADLPARPPQANPNRVYILGPMRGIPQYNFPAFDAMEKELRRWGYDPVNPAALDRDHGFVLENVPANQDWTKMPAGMKIRDIVLRDLRAVMSCGSYIALPGYEKSKGATAEKGVLDWLGATRLEQSTSWPDSFATFVNPAHFAAAANGVPFPVSGCSTEPPTQSTACTGGRIENPKDAAGRKKTPLGLVPWVGVVALSRVMKLGAAKYGPNNWRRSNPCATVYVEAAMRHLLAYLDGQDIDPESKESHLAHVMANMCILMDAAAVGSLNDDRPKSGVVVSALEKAPS